MAIKLTKSSTPIIGWVAIVLGWIMNGIYFVINGIGIPNVGLAIILFTIIIYALMTPLQIKQQRFSKLNTIMQPELSRIQDKYRGKKDQVSQQKMLDETNAVYEKYGVSQMGSCLQLLIQMPILFALYQVIYRIPGYITIIGDQIRAVAEDSSFVTFFTDFVTKLESSNLSASLKDGAVENVIDTVYKLNTNQWTQLLAEGKGETFETALTGVHKYVSSATNFMGLNISDSPMNVIQTSWASKNWLMIVVAVLIPLFAWGTQVLNFKMMPQPNKKRPEEMGTMEQSMQSMNTMMPLMSAFFCLTLPVGIGLYWIIGAVVRTVQMFVINKMLDRESIDDIIKKAQDKANAKRAKQGLPPQKITNNAHVSTRSIAADEKLREEAQAKKSAEAQQKMKESTEYYKKSARPGSIAAKANMVKQYDERNLKKK
ncbi:MAG: YidC/Oxa1 family membrane protein insertase [Lachnospiraceae bacterium]|nr:YidC/Oxa1 family membrane protein insertase [Lachnospiraceae bacterium]